MKPNTSRLLRLVLVFASTLALAMVLVSEKTRAQDHVPVHMTTDWSNRHMVYTAPSTFEEAWRLRAEPRYLEQFVRRNSALYRSAN
jgi:hypothetical protein